VLIRVPSLDSASELVELMQFWRLYLSNEISDAREDRPEDRDRDLAENSVELGKDVILVDKQRPLQGHGVDVERMYFFFPFDLIPIFSTPE
jgi:hypothetical protein